MRAQPAGYGALSATPMGTTPAAPRGILRRLADRMRRLRRRAEPAEPAEPPMCEILGGGVVLLGLWLEYEDGGRSDSVPIEEEVTKVLAGGPVACQRSITGLITAGVFMLRLAAVATGEEERRLLASMGTHFATFAATLDEVP